MAKRAIPAVSTAEPRTGTTLPYEPSWLDRLMGAVESLPMPFWLTYLLLGLAECLALQLVLWLGEPATRFVWRSETALFPLWTWGVLALITHLNHEAIKALRNFRPLLPDEDVDMQLLKYEITTMPARTVLLGAPLWLAVFALIAMTNATIQEHRANPIVFPVSLIAGAAAFLIGSGIYVHSVHQLRMVNRLYHRMRKINMFHLFPVYSFSGLTAQTAVGYITLILVTQLLYPHGWGDLDILVLNLGQILLAVAVFILPLSHAHTRLVNGKQRLQAEAAQRMETALQRLHAAVDEENVAALDGLNKIVAAVSNERDMLAKIPTWPWQPGTLRTVASVMLVPVLLFLIQAILRRWLGL
jgi:hypothetical protein